MASTSVIGTIIIYEYPSAKKITSFRAYGALPQILWDSEENLIFRDPQEVTPPREYESGEGQGIAKISLPSGQKQILLRADAKYDYYLFGVNNNLVYYLPLDPNNPAETNKQIVSPTRCSQITSKGQNNQLVDCQSIPSQQIATTVSSNLPVSLAGYSVTHCLPSSKDAAWVLCDFYKSGSVSKIGLFNTKNPQSGVTNIFDGSNSSW